MTLTNKCSNGRIKERYLRKFGKKEGTVKMKGKTWKEKLIELINTYDISEETLEICFWLIVQRIKRGK